MGQSKKAGAPIRATAQDLDRGEKFGQWLQVALERAGLNMRTAAIKAGMSPSGLSVFVHGGLDAQTGKVRRPDEETIRILASVLGADEDRGRVAAGYMPNSGATEDIGDVLSGLPKAQARMARLALQTFLEAVRPEIDPIAEIGREVDTRVFGWIPMVAGRASAGDHGLDSLNETDGTLADRIPVNLRAVEVRGTCMMPEFDEGDVLLVALTSEAASGDNVIALTADERLVCKRFRCPDGPRSARLESLDGVVVADFGEFRVMGVVAGFYRRLRRDMPELEKVVA